MSDYFSFRNQNFLKASSSTSEQETESFSIFLRKKKRIDAQKSLRKNNLNNLLDPTTQNPYFSEKNRFQLQNSIKANTSNDENLVIEQVFLESLLESKSQSLNSFINFEYLEKIMSDLVLSPFPDPVTSLNLLEMFLKDKKGKNIEKNPDLLLRLCLKLVKNSKSEENFLNTLKILSIFLNKSRKFCESFKKSEEFVDFFMFFKRKLSQNSQFAVVEAFKSFSNSEEILNDFEVSAFFDSLSSVLKICDLKVKKKCLGVLVKIIQGHDWSSEIFMDHELFMYVVSGTKEEILFKNYCKIVSVCSCGSNRQMQRLLDSDILNEFCIVFNKKFLNTAKHVYFTLANIVAGTSDQFSQLLAHPVFEESLKHLIELDLDGKIEASFYIRNLMKLTSEYIKIQILQNSFLDSVQELLLTPDSNSVINFLTVFEEILKIFGREYFIQRKFETSLEALLRSNSWEVNKRASEILYSNY